MTRTLLFLLLDVDHLAAMKFRAHGLPYHFLAIADDGNDRIHRIRQGINLMGHDGFVGHGQKGLGPGQGQGIGPGRFSGGKYNGIHARRLHEFYWNGKGSMITVRRWIKPDP